MRILPTNDAAALQALGRLAQRRWRISAALPPAPQRRVTDHGPPRRWVGKGDRPVRARHIDVNV